MIAVYDTTSNSWKIVASLLASALKVADVNGFYNSKNIEGVLTEIANQNFNKITRVELDGDSLSFFSSYKLVDKVKIPVTTEMLKIIGDITKLATQTKLNTVDAINELVGRMDDYNKLLGDYSASLSKLKGVHVGSTPPPSTDMIWINNGDQNNLGIGVPNDGALENLRQVMKSLIAKVELISYSINYKIDAGLMVPTETVPPVEGSKNAPINPEIPPLDPDFVPNIPDGTEGNVKRIAIKRGLKKELIDYQIMNGEMVLCEDTEEVYIGVRGKKRLLGRANGAGGGESGGSGNLTGEYVDLISPNGTKYRVTVTDSGKLFVYPASIDDAEPPKPSDASRFKGLLVQQVYGGGVKGCGGTPITHGFIELYNGSENPINLKGFSVQYGEYDRPWEVLPLKGIVHPFTSFLIRCARHSEDSDPSVRLRLSKSDMDWDIPITDIGKKVLLYIGTTSVNLTNPSNADGLGNPVEGYIDMIGAGGSDVTRLIDGYETRYGQWFDKFTSVHRHDFKDSVNGTNKVGDNRADCRPLDYRYIDVDVYGPRCSTDGLWDIYYDKPKLDPYKPELLSIFFGPNGDTQRNFSWQTPPTNKGYVQYRKKGEDKFLTVESIKRHVQHRDGDATVHGAGIDNLTPGIYEYRAGEDGKWSDLYEFEVKTYTANDTMRILHTTDQQGWDGFEYECWMHASKFIMQNEQYDWRVNTGDISQNGGRSFEWRYYYEHAKEDLRTKIEMTCAGNNDLLAPDKNDSTPFTYYSYYRNQPYPSVYRFDVGLCTFIVLHPWAAKDIAVEDFERKQLEWFEAEMAKNDRRRWTIVLMHVAPYTVVQMKLAQPYLPIIEKYKVDMVMCGHNHCYSRSKMIYNKQVDEYDGILHIMSQATGFKLTGKSGPAATPEWYYGHAETPQQPAYIIFEVTNDSISFHSYYVDGVKLIDPSTKLPYYGDPKNFKKFEFDSGTIKHRTLRTRPVIKEV